MDTKKTLETLTDGLAGYELIVDKEVHYVYLKKNRYHELVLKPHKRNFLHLTGIKYIDVKTGRKVSASKFYDVLKNKKVDPKGIKKTTYTDQKLQVISHLKELVGCNLRIIDEQSTYLNLSFSHAIRTRRKVFCLTLENFNGDYFVPVSLLNIKNGPKGNTIKSGHPVDCIYIVDKKEKNIQILCRTKQFIDYEEKHGYTYKSNPETV